MALPNDKISTTLVANTLGTNSRDVGTLCTHQAINKWSKWKPVRFNKVTGLIESDLRNTRAGMLVPEFDDYLDLRTYYKGSPSPIWDYGRPSGGANSPYRLGDFRGYEHSATQFFSVDIPDRVFESSNPTVNVPISTNTSGGRMNWDITNFYGYYFGGAAIRSSLQNPIGLDLQEIPITSTGQGALLEIPIPSPFVGATYDIIAFLFTGDPELQPFQPSKLYALEGGFRTVSYLRGLRIDLLGTLNSLNRLTWTLEITNLTSAQISINTVTVWARYEGKQPTDPLETGENYQSLGTITIPAGQIYSNSGTFNNVLEDYDIKGGDMYFSNTTNPGLNNYFPITYQA